MRSLQLVLALLVALLLPACVVVTDDGGGGGGGSASSGSSQGVATFSVVNDSSQSIFYVYVSPASELVWGEDLLEEDVLAPGETGSITLDAGDWDVKVVTENGQELIYYDQVFDGSGDYYLTVTDQ